MGWEGRPQPRCGWVNLGLGPRVGLVPRPTLGSVGMTPLALQWLSRVHAVERGTRFTRSRGGHGEWTFGSQAGQLPFSEWLPRLASS
jgi:hypothetical protein